MLTANSVELRVQTDDDEAVLYRIAADLDTWEERSPRSPAPLTLAGYRERVTSGTLEGNAVFVVALDGRAVGSDEWR